MNNLELGRIIREELKDLIKFVQLENNDDSISFSWETVKENDNLILYINLKSFINLTVKMKINNNENDKNRVIDMCKAFKNLLFMRALLNKY